MKRRAFLSLLGAAGIAPVLPSAGAPASVAVGYNRYMYGLAVFHARTRASISAADLIARLKVSAVQADAMMGEMTTKGVIAPLAKATTATARQALDPQYETGLRKVARTTSDWMNAKGEQALEADGQLTGQIDLTGVEDEDQAPHELAPEDLENDLPN